MPKPAEPVSTALVKPLKAALAYREGGMEPIPIPRGRKDPAPSERALGFKVTGQHDERMGPADLADYILNRTWTDRVTGEQLPYENIGLVMPPGVVGLDVDAYDDRPGASALAHLEQLSGGLPVTFTTTSRDDGISGIYLFRCDDADELRDIPGLEIVRPGHRYAMAEPSVHPEGRSYRWFFGGELSDAAPSVAELPTLPDCVAAFLKPCAATAPVGGPFESVEPAPRRDTSARLDSFLRALESGGATGSRHSEARDLTAHLVATGQADDVTLTLVRREWVRYLPDRVYEFDSALRSAREKFTPEQLDAATPLDGALSSGLLDLSKLLTEGAPDPEWLVEPLIPAKRTTLVTAGAKTGKSLLICEAVFAVSLGRPFLGEQPSRPVRVLYLDYEMTDSDLVERLESMGYGPDDGAALAESLAYYQNPLLRPLDTAEGAADLLGLVELHRPDLLVIDTWSRVISGNENDSDPYRDFYRLAMIPLKARGIAVVLADHTGHENKQRSRGSSAKLDMVDLAWTLKKTEEGIDLKRQAQRISWAPDRISIKRDENATPIHTRINGGVPAGTKECADLLDRLGIPLEVGDRKARVLVKEVRDTAPRANVLRAAQKYRRQRLLATWPTAGAPADAPSSPPPDAVRDAA